MTCNCHHKASSVLHQLEHIETTQCIDREDAGIRGMPDRFCISGYERNWTRAAGQPTCKWQLEENPMRSSGIITMVKESWTWSTWSHAILSTAIFAALPLWAQTPAQPDASAALAHAVGPFLQNNCETCHNTSLPSGDVDMQRLLATPNSLRDMLVTWREIAFFGCRDDK